MSNEASADLRGLAVFEEIRMHSQTPTEQRAPVTREAAAATLRRLQAEAARRAEAMTAEEREELVQEIDRDVKERLNARLDAPEAI